MFNEPLKLNKLKYKKNIKERLMEESSCLAIILTYLTLI